jgi:hypothetical protein
LTPNEKKKQYDSCKVDFRFVNAIKAMGEQTAETTQSDQTMIKLHFIAY